jgi:arabinogalactan oligomer/maltooligosaccharide transport system permease protein
MNIYHWTNFTFNNGQNYIRALTVVDEGFIGALVRTFLWTLVNLILQFVIALVLALMLNVEGLKFKGLYKTILMISWAMPGYISALIWKYGMFHNDFGLLNQLLHMAGLKGVEWLNSDFMAFVSCLIVNLWLALPFMILMIYGGLQSIDHVYYEIAQIEGAKLMIKTARITLPLLKPVLIPAIAMTTFVTFKQFDIVYLMTQQTGSKTGANIHTVITYAYEKAFVTNNYGYSSALSVIIFAIIVAFTVLNQRYLKSGGEVD